MKKLILCAVLLAGACHDRSGPPAPTSDQADQLNDAEDMLNGMAGNEEGPEAKAPDPSNLLN